MENLAIFGGKPVRENKIAYGKQLIEDDDIAAVVETLKSPYLISDPIHITLMLKM